MKVYNHKIVMLLLIAAVIQITACKQKTNNYVNIHPAHIEHIEGSEFNKLKLTEKAIERTDIKIGEITEELITQSEPQLKKVCSYGAIIYGPYGETWVYTNPESDTYIRHEIKVDYIQDGKVILSEGPPTGTKLVIQGAAELYGAEYDVGH